MDVQSVTILISLGGALIALLSLSVSWRAHRRAAKADRRSLAADKAIATQRILPVLDLGLSLAVADVNSLSNHAHDRGIFAQIASTVEAAILDVAKVYPELVHRLDELHRLARNVAQEHEQELSRTDLIWLYYRAYSELWVLSGYALVRHNPAAGGEFGRRAVDDQYWNRFDSRHKHFWREDLKGKGFLPPRFFTNSD
ncbi:MAG: hypothetical protein ABR611_00640 [Chthoniobacterales bacterium]